MDTTTQHCDYRYRTDEFDCGRTAIRVEMELSTMSWTRHLCATHLELALADARDLWALSRHLDD